MIGSPKHYISIFKTCSKPPKICSFNTIHFFVNTIAKIIWIKDASVACKPKIIAEIIYVMNISVNISFFMRFTPFCRTWKSLTIIKRNPMIYTANMYNISIIWIYSKSKIIIVLSSIIKTRRLPTHHIYIICTWYSSRLRTTTSKSPILSLIITYIYTI